MTKERAQQSVRLKAEPSIASLLHVDVLLDDIEKVVVVDHWHKVLGKKKSFCEFADVKLKL